MKEQKTVLKNGIELYSIKNPSSHGFFISLFVRAGALYEKSNESGITHFLEHVTIRNVNAKMSGELYQTLDRYGIEFNASTYSEMVQFYLSGAVENFDIAADILSKLASPIILSAREISAERDRIKAEIRENDEKNSLVAFSNSIVHEGTSLANSITGTLGGVSKINLARLEEYRKSVFTKENLFLYVTGNYTEEAIERLGGLVGEWELYSGEPHLNVAPVSQNFGKRDGKVHLKSADYTVIRFNFDIDMSRVSVPECDLIYDILFGGYSSRFFIEMSERRGIFYDVSGNVERYKNIGTLAFTFEVRSDRIYEAVELSLLLLYDMVSQRLSDSECMKAGYVDNAEMLADDAREQNFTFAYDNHILAEGYKTLSERAKRYSDITPERISEASRIIFAPENLTLTIKGRKKAIDKDRLEALIKDYKKRYYASKDNESLQK